MVPYNMTEQLTFQAKKHHSQATMGNTQASFRPLFNHLSRVVSLKHTVPQLHTFVPVICPVQTQSRLLPTEATGGSGP